MKYFILPLGCMTNKVDAERLAAILEEQGYTKAEKEADADLFAVVACSVREAAVHSIHGHYHNWKKLKKIKPREFILTGCVLPEDKKKLAKKFDKIMTIEELYADFNLNTKRFSSFQAGVPIMRGCNNFCTYCAVPYTRGREHSLPFKQIFDEVKKLIEQGYKEITLLGQNVNSYEYDFPKLLEKIAKLEGNFWLRFTSPHPKDFSDKLIEVIAKNHKICNQINLPVQSGSEKILKAMNRPYTLKQYKDIVKKIRKAIPDISLSTDTIVGFPGETEKDFQNTIKLYKEMKFDMAFIAQYSVRPGTAAAKAFKDNIPKKKKVERDKALTEILKQNALEYHQQFVGQTMKVLIEKYRKNKWLGRTFHGKSASITDKAKNLEGKFINVKITKADSWSLQGKIHKN